jgi:hypothetical protein
MSIFDEEEYDDDGGNGEHPSFSEGILDDDYEE